MRTKPSRRRWRTSSRERRRRVEVSTRYSRRRDMFACGTVFKWAQKYKSTYTRIIVARLGGVIRLELERNAVHAVPEPGAVARAVVEHVPEVALADGAPHLRARQKHDGVVGHLGHRLGADRLDKEGHPVPLSYFALDANSGSPQPAHANVPTRFSELSGRRRTGVPWLPCAEPRTRTGRPSASPSTRRRSSAPCPPGASPPSQRRCRTRPPARAVATNAVVAAARFMRRRRGSETASRGSSRGASADARSDRAPRRAPGSARRVVRAGRRCGRNREQPTSRGVWVARRECAVSRTRHVILPNATPNHLHVPTQRARLEHPNCASATRAARVARRDEPLAFPRASVVAPRADRRSRARRARTLLHARAGRRDGGAGVLPRCRRRVRGRGAHFHDHAHLLRGWHQGYDRRGHRQREGTRHVGRGGAATNAKRARSADVPPSVFPTSSSFRPLSEPLWVLTNRDAYAKAYASPPRN